MLIVEFLIANTKIFAPDWESLSFHFHSSSYATGVPKIIDRRVNWKRVARIANYRNKDKTAPRRKPTGLFGTFEKSEHVGDADTTDPLVGAAALINHWAALCIPDKALVAGTG